MSTPQNHQEMIPNDEDLPFQDRLFVFFYATPSFSNDRTGHRWPCAVGVASKKKGKNCVRSSWKSGSEIILMARLFFCLGMAKSALGKLK